MKIVYDYRRFWASIFAILACFFSGHMTEGLTALHRVPSTVQDLECFSILGQTPQIYERIYSVV